MVKFTFSYSRPDFLGLPGPSLLNSARQGTRQTVLTVTVANPNNSLAFTVHYQFVSEQIIMQKSHVASKLLKLGVRLWTEGDFPVNPIKIAQCLAPKD